MTITVPCRGGGEQIGADDEGTLVARVDDHIRDVHNSPHAPAREPPPRTRHARRGPGNRSLVSPLKPISDSTPNDPLNSTVSAAA